MPETEWRLSAPHLHPSRSSCGAAHPSVQGRGLQHADSVGMVRTGLPLAHGGRMEQEEGPHEGPSERKAL